MTRRSNRWLALGASAGLWLYAPAGAVAQPRTGGLRLEDAVNFALARNERARIDDLNVVVAEAAIERARGGFLPVLVASGNEIAHAQTVTSQSADIGSGVVTLTQPIVNASAWPLYAQARALADAQRSQSADDKRLLAFAAASSFLNVLSAQGILDAAERQFENARSNLDYAQARAAAQLTSSNDVTRAQVDMAGSQREVAADTGAYQNDVLQLAYLLNAPVSPPLVSPDQALKAAQIPLASIDPWVRFAVDHRPDIQADRHAAAAAHHFADEPLLRLVPTLSANASATGTTNLPTPSAKWHDETVSATLTWTLFDSGLRYADKRSRDAQASIAELNLTQLVRSVETQVRGSAALLAAAQGAFVVAGEAMLAARQNVEETQILYKQGLAKAIELVDANDARFTAEVNYAGAQYAMAQAYLNFRQALGEDALGAILP